VPTFLKNEIDSTSSPVKTKNDNFELEPKEMKTFQGIRYVAHTRLEVSVDGHESNHGLAVLGLEVTFRHEFKVPSFVATHDDDRIALPIASIEELLLQNLR
jgi:hypothetical protein